MGFLSGIIGGIGSVISGIGGVIGGAVSGLVSSGGSRSSSSGSSSSSKTIYEPDKVKIAEIESDTKIKLAHMEAERIELMKQAKLDILEYETKSKIALEQARAQGLTVMAQTIIAMQEKLNEIAMKRLEIIEKGSLPIIKEIERFYEELGNTIKEDNHKYSKEKLPELMSILNQYEEGTPIYNLYLKRIEGDIELQTTHYMQQLEAITKRQTSVIDSFLSSKDKIIEQTGQLTASMLETIEKQKLALESNLEETSQEMLSSNERLALPS